MFESGTIRHQRLPARCRNCILINSGVKAAISRHHTNHSRIRTDSVDLADGFINDANERNARIRMYAVQEYVRRVAHHHEKIGAGILEPLRHRGQCVSDVRRAFTNGALPIRNRRVLIHNHVDMVLIAAGIRQRDNPGHEIHGGIRAHATHHANDFLTIFRHCHYRSDLNCGRE